MYTSSVWFDYEEEPVYRHVDEAKVLKAQLMQ